MPDRLASGAHGLCARDFSLRCCILESDATESGVAPRQGQSGAKYELGDGALCKVHGKAGLGLSSAEKVVPSQSAPISISHSKGSKPSFSRRRL